MTAAPQMSQQPSSVPAKAHASTRAEIALLSRLLVLGAANKSNAAFEQTMDIAWNDFVLRPHQLIWHAMKQVYARHDPINLTTIEAELDRPLKDKSLKAIEEVTPAYLAELMTQRHGDIAGSAKLIRRAAIRRKMRLMSRDVEAIIDDESKSELDVMDQALDVMSRMAQQVQALDGHAGTTMHAALGEVFSQIGAKQRAVSAGDTSSYGISTGYPALDNVLHGFKRGHLYVIAARPSVGKSALAMNLSLEAMRQNARVLFVPLEMTALEMTARALSIESGLAGSDIETGNVSIEDLDLLTVVTTRLQGYRASQQFHFLEFEPLPTMAQIEIKIHQHMTIHGADLIVFDQMSPEAVSPMKPDLTLHKFMSDTVNTLRTWAKKYNVPVLSMAQLNREGDRTTDGKPRLTHLAGSDSISRAANAVILLHRETAVVRDMGDMVDVIVAKNRGGDETTIQLRYIPQITKFVSFP